MRANHLGPHAWWPALLALLVACQTPTDVYRKLLYVTVMLDPSLRRQAVVVDESYRQSDSVPYSWIAGIRDATVRIWPESASSRYDDTVVLGPSQSIPNYGGYPHWEFRTYWGFRLRPCSTYVISVTRRDVEEQKDFAGEMHITIPDTFSITSPVPGETLRSGALPALTWRRSRLACGYVALAYHCSFDSLLGEALYWGASCPYITKDTVIPAADYEELFFYRGTGVSYELSVYAFNEDLYRQKIARADRFSVDTIGTDVIADYGAQTVARVRVEYGTE